MIALRKPGHKCWSILSIEFSLDEYREIERAFLRKKLVEDLMKRNGRRAERYVEFVEVLVNDQIFCDAIQNTCKNWKQLSKTLENHQKYTTPSGSFMERLRHTQQSNRKHTQYNIKAFRQGRLNQSIHH